MGPIWQTQLGRAWLCSSAPVGSQIHCPVGHQIWGPLGKEDVSPNFALTVGKFVFSNSGNFSAKTNPPKPRSCPKRTFRAWSCHHGPIDSWSPQIKITRDNQAWAYCVRASTRGRIET